MEEMKRKLGDFQLHDTQRCPPFMFKESCRLLMNFSTMGSGKTFQLARLLLLIQGRDDLPQEQEEMPEGHVAFVAMLRKRFEGGNPFKK
jgi:hypothetical protein